MSELDNLGDLPTVDETAREPESTDIVEVAYKHHGVRNFAVGEFEFKDHILRIRGTRAEVAAKVEHFKELYVGLLGPDRTQIVKLRAVQNEVPVIDSADRASRRVSGAVGTADIADREAGSRAEPVKNPVSAGGQPTPAKAAPGGLAVRNPLSALRRN